MKQLVTMCILVSFAVNTVLPPAFVHAGEGRGISEGISPQPNPVLDRPGQSMTLLHDGHWLLVGGEGPGGPQARASLWDPHNETLTLLGAPIHARAGHSATVLPDGSVLIFGGIGSNEQIVDEAELFVPATQAFVPLSIPGLTSRAYHSATLLTDGRVLIAGGVSSHGETLNTADLWDFRTPQSAIRLPQLLVTARRNHTAVLLPTGEVLLWGGIDSTGSEVKGGEWYDPATQAWSALRSQRTTVTSDGSGPRVVASIPTEGAGAAPLDSLIALRFSTPLQVETINAQTITLHQDETTQTVTVVAAEGGILAFVLPQVSLQPASPYTLTVEGPQDEAGQVVPLTTLHFTTAPQKSVPARVARTADEPKDKEKDKGPTPKGPDRDSEDWIPDDTNKRGDWNSHRKDPAEKSLPPLQADGGVTALAGQVFVPSVVSP